MCLHLLDRSFGCHCLQSFSCQCFRFLEKVFLISNVRMIKNDLAKQNIYRDTDPNHFILKCNYLKKQRNLVIPWKFLCLPQVLGNQQIYGLFNIIVDLYSSRGGNSLLLELKQNRCLNFLIDSVLGNRYF